MAQLPMLKEEPGKPLYRQLFEHFAERIRAGEMPQGERMPATRELAGLLGWNRATVSAAYELLEAEGLISGHVGRGSFVTGRGASAAFDWSSRPDQREPELSSPAGSLGPGCISFAVSRPSSALFPLDDFRESCAAVLRRNDLADILQLGAPSGYGPLRKRLLEDARRAGLAGPGDDLIVTNGCQQALDLIARVMLNPGDRVLVEDPAYPGLRNLLSAAGAQLTGAAVRDEGIDAVEARRVMERERPRMAVITPNFQNPTGATLSLGARRGFLDAAHAAGVPVIENDPYGDLRYGGEPVPALKQLDESGGTVLLRSFSKASFPGLRVGWALGPKALIERLRRAKESSDLHTDQLSQAVLLEFMESGRLDAHRARVLRAGAERLAATLEACARYLPPGSRWTRPEGGMNVWVRLPRPLDAGELLPRAQKEGVSFLPGRYFAVSRPDHGALRLSFAGLLPEEIRKGISILGKIFSDELESASGDLESSPAMV